MANTFDADLERKFVWRRVARHPDGVRRADLVEAFGMKPNRASELLTREINGSGGALERANAHRVTLRPGSTIPSYANESDLLRSMGLGLLGFAHTGLRPAELPINLANFSRQAPASEGVLWALMQAILQRQHLYIDYVSMKLGDRGKTRWLYPLSLDRVGDQWQLSAHDLENVKDQFPVHFFLLTRMFKAHPSTGYGKRLPKGFVPSNSRDTPKRVPVRFNKVLTPRQVHALRRELDVEVSADDQEYITLSHRTEFQFFRKYANERVGEDYVDPLVERAQR
jgi:hypothetical protein